MELTSIIEALLTASDEALPAEEIARLIRARVAEAEDVRARQIEEGEQPPELPDWLTPLATLSGEQVVAAIGELNRHYRDTHRAFTLSERAKGWRIFTRGDYGEFVRQLFPGRRPERLSAPAMETLAIIAYRQPITKAAIEAVRGVSCDGMLQKLLDRELVRIGGRAELPGRPLLYETTELFFEHFGIRSIDDLPNAGELRKVKLPEPSDATPAPGPEEQLALKAAGADAAPTEDASQISK
ncbi:segregation and condensation protein B [Haloferula luteola]|uniref:Segregation and condensation protein B n=1 Tax=Haloferula luteola TaxID=595692 RepID=A0A840V8K8_9BACT|nr:SMC-Scp complex subunit ScpB [Haloferula luteola]MBB5350119.1 segregation and condensation protein B [Haloferula luteola]